MNKNSEGVLVGVVVAVLALIMLGAWLFGEGGKPLDVDDGSRKVEADSSLDGFFNDEVDTAEAAAKTDAALAKEAAEAQKDAELAIDGGVDGERGDQEGEVRIDPSGAVAELGVSRREDWPDGTSYRLVTVRDDDTFQQLVLHWTGGLDRLGEVERLNEDIDPDRLIPGSLLRLPWVDDLVLMRAMRERRDRNQRPLELRVRADRPVVVENDAASRTPVSGGTAADFNFGRDGATRRPAVRETSTPTPAPSSGSGSYTIEKNDSLWKIAAKRVGPAKAAAYVDRILAANPQITSADRIREGQKIVLP